MQVIGSSPQLQASFDVGAVFSYLMKTKNVNIEQFRITNPAQVQQNMMAQQQAGQPQTTAEGAPVGPPPRMAGPATNGAGAGVPRQ